MKTDKHEERLSPEDRKTILFFLFLWGGLSLLGNPRTYFAAFILLGIAAWVLLKLPNS